MFIKNINPGKIKILIFFLFTIIAFKATLTLAEENSHFGKKVDIKILDKLSSKNKLIKLNVGEENIFKNLIIKVLKCKNSEFDDNPEITAYLQVKDNNIKNKDKVFNFNGWTFASSPTLNPFDHPIYDIWLKKCFN